MKTIQSLCMTVLLCLVFTACEKDDFTLTSEDQVLPHLGVLDSVENQDMWMADHQTTYGDDRIVPSTIVRITSKLTATLDRWDTRLPAAGDGELTPDIDSKTYGIVTDEIIAYSIAGYGEAVNDKIGWTSVEVSLQSDHRTRELHGLIALESLDERTSTITFRAWGFCDIQEVAGSSGVSFRLEVIAANGRYAGIEKFANGTLTHYVEDLCASKAESAAQLNINVVFRPVLRY